MANISACLPRPIGFDQGRYPAEGVGEESAGAGGGVSAVRVISNGDGDAALASPEEKALDLSLDVELVLAAVADEEIEFARFQVVALHDLDRIEGAELGHGVRAASDL